MHALIIDDSRALRRILANMLSNLDFTVAEAGDGQQALDYLEDGTRPHVVLLDWNMPQMNGLEFLRAVRADQEFADLPVMMVTSETDVEFVELALQAGANEYLMKPFNEDAIADKLTLLGLYA